MRIRDADAGDWPAIWPFLREIMRAGETYTVPRGIGADDARAMWLPGPPAHTVVAVDDDGTVLGTARTGPNHSGGAAHVAGGSFLVDPAHGGRGVGRALGEYVVGWARDRGFRIVQFNAVVETNTGAVALWRSLGFEILGTLPEAFHHPVRGDVGLHVMYRRL